MTLAEINALFDTESIRALNEKDLRQYKEYLNLGPEVLAEGLEISYQSQPFPRLREINYQLSQLPWGEPTILGSLGSRLLTGEKMAITDKPDGLEICRLIIDDEGLALFLIEDYRTFACFALLRDFLVLPNSFIEKLIKNRGGLIVTLTEKDLNKQPEWRKNSYITKLEVDQFQDEGQPIVRVRRYTNNEYLEAESAL